MSLRDIPLDVITKVIKSSSSKRDVLKNLGFAVSGWSSVILNEIINQHDIDISHFGGRHGVSSEKMTDEEYFSNGVKRNGTHLKNRLIKDGHVIEKCSECGIGPEWNGKPLSLQVDHEDGDHLNNSLSNLRLMCPNCHSQTTTWGGKRFKKERNCKKCGVPIHISNKSGVCKKCCLSTPKNRKFNPSKEELQKLIDENSFVKVGKIFGVSDKSVSKRCKYFGIEKRGNQI